MRLKPGTRIHAPGKPGAALLAQLEALRDKHRLGLHIWESVITPSYPSQFCNELEHWKQGDSSRLQSLSLMPPRGDGFSMEGYCCNTAVVTHAGYLMDLSEGSSTAATVVACRPSGMFSGNDSQKKRYKPEDAAMALDEMARLYAKPRKGKVTVAVGFNEVLAAVGKQHVRAIVIPVMTGDRRGRAHFATAARLVGALAGLNHLEQNESYPVVLYHVRGEPFNSFSYVGKSFEELDAVARQSAQTIAEDWRNMKWLRNQYNKNHIWKELKHHTGIDMQELGERLDREWRRG